MDLISNAWELREPSERDPSPNLFPSGGNDDKRDVFHVVFDPETESVAEVVASAVSVIHNEAPDELDPLYDVVDPDALGELVASPSDEEVVVEVQFVYEGLEITIDSNGHLWLEWQ